MTSVQAAVDILKHAQRDWDMLTQDKRKQMLEDAYNQLVVSGEEIMESPVTGDKYRVTEWIEKGDGRVVAVSKEPVEGGK